MRRNEILIKAKEIGISEKQQDLIAKYNPVLQDVLNKNLITIDSNLSILKQKRTQYRRDYLCIEEIKNSAEQIVEYANQILEDSVLEKLFKENKFFDEDKLRELYVTRKIKKALPHFDLDEFIELLKKPIREIENDDGEIIKIDPFVTKKINIALIQAIFDEMDIYMVNCGIEGSGKSCHSSRWIKYIFLFLSKCGLINYKYDVKKLFYSSLPSMMEAMLMQETTERFRMFVLDEGNDLNRSNFREAQNKNFKFNMRTSRKNSNIVVINIQQLGELDTSVTLSRTNFIFDCEIKNSTRTGTLKKGNVTMYILPRGEYIYSKIHKREFSKIDIRNAFAERLDKKKDYYISLPKEFAIYNYTFEGIWGFDKAEYDEFIKNENRKRLMGEDVKMTVYDAYKLMLKLPPLKRWGTIDLKNPRDKTIYWSIQKLVKKIKQYFISHPEQRLVCENLLSSEGKYDEEGIPEESPTPRETVPDLQTEKPKTFYKNPTN